MPAPYLAGPLRECDGRNGLTVGISTKRKVIYVEGDAEGTCGDAVVLVVRSSDMRRAVGRTRKKGVEANVNAERLQATRMP